MRAVVDQSLVERRMPGEKPVSADALARTAGSCPECNGGHTCHPGNGYSGHAASCSRNPGRQT